MRVHWPAALVLLAACGVEGEGPPSQPFYDGGYVIEGELPADYDLEELLADMAPGEIAVVGDPLTGEVATIQSTATPLARVANVDFSVISPATCTNCGGGCPPTTRTISTTLRHTSGMGGESFTVVTSRALNFTNVVSTPSSFVRAIGADVTIDSTGDVVSCTQPFSYRFNLVASPRAFVTSTSYNGNLGGTAGADAKCQAQADASGLGGTWKAWIADAPTGLPNTRFTGNGPWYKVNSTVKIADNLADLSDGSIDALLNNTELGVLVNPSNKVVWTGIAQPNSVGLQTCTNWTGTAGSGRRGSTVRSNTQWVDAGTSICTGPRGLYCFEQ